MMLLKQVIIFVAVLYIVWRVLQGLGKSINRGKPGADAFSPFSAHSRDRRRRAQERGQSETLVPCAGCGTSVPSSRVVRADDNKTYCRECADS